MKNKFSFLFLFFLILQLQAQESPAVLNHELVLKIQEGSLAYAKSNNHTMAIAIYDVHANLISFIRMDGATVGVSKVARWKGISAASWLKPTSETGKWNMATAPNMATAMGGIPIFSKDGTPLGGIGVSGAASEIDVECGEAGLKAAGLTKEAPEE